ncbi:MAG: DUF167 family protein [Patescibacteria group bacterium]
MDENGYIRVKVKTDCKKEVIRVLADGRLEICLKIKPEKGLANHRLLEVVSKYFKGKKVVIISGQRLPNKLLKII